jgi:hypothetical protein
VQCDADHLLLSFSSNYYSPFQLFTPSLSPASWQGISAIYFVNQKSAIIPDQLTSKPVIARAPAEESSFII